MIAKIALNGVLGVPWPGQPLCTGNDARVR